LYVKEILDDCDNDTLLVKVNPAGPACHTGSDTCWGERNMPYAESAAGFTSELESIIESRRDTDPESSYTAKLLAGGPRKIAKKLGEESAELIIEAMDDRDDLFLEEAADLLYHYLVLLHGRNFKLADVENILRERHK